MALSSTPRFDLPRDDKEAAALSQLRESLSLSSPPSYLAKDDEHSSYFLSNDGTLLRFLRARDGNVKNAIKMIHNAYTWRKENDPPNMTCPKCTNDPLAHSVRIVGWDKQGRPVLYTCFNQANDRWDATVNIKHLVICLEHALTLIQKRGGSLSNPSGKWVLVADFNGFELRDSSPSMAVQTAKILDHYPELLGWLCLLNAPRLFSATWVAVRRIINEVTANKVKFITCSKDDGYKPYLEHELGDEMASWLVEEIKENALPENKYKKKYWEWINIDGTVKEHDARGTKSYVSSEYFISPVVQKFCQSLSLKQ